MNLSISDNKLFAPNSFSPNGDNCNDKFYLSGLGDFIDFNLKVYKRWGGDIVYESEDIGFMDNFTDDNLSIIPETPSNLHRSMIL